MTCRRWFGKFETRDFDLSDKLRSGRPALIDDYVVKQDHFLTTAEIAERLNAGQQIILDHFQKIGLVACILFYSKNGQNLPVDLI